MDKHSISAEKGAYISIAAYIFLSALKLSFGYFGDSKGLWADGLNNTTDIIASIAVLIGLKISKRPPDDNHSYGHLRAETVASLVAAFIMITVGLQVVFSAIESFFHQDSTTVPSMLTGYVALFSAIFMYGIYRYNLTLSKKSTALPSMPLLRIIVPMPLSVLVLSLESSVLRWESLGWMR